MTLKQHTIYGAVAAAALYPTLGVNSLAFLAGAVLIDIDHYLCYIYHTGFTDFSPRRMFDYHHFLANAWWRPEFLNLSIFHSAEALSILFLTAYYTGSAAILTVGLGMIFHMLLDMLMLYKNGIFFHRSYFFLDYIIRKRLLKRRGIDVTSLYLEAAETVRA